MLTHTFNGPFSGTTRASRYQKGKTNPDFTVARDSEWQWHQLGHMQVCISLQTDNHASTPPLSFLQARCPSCRPTNSVKALKANAKPSRNCRHCWATAKPEACHTHPIDTDWGPVWHARVDLWSLLTCQISPGTVYFHAISVGFYQLNC